MTGSSSIASHSHLACVWFRPQLGHWICWQFFFWYPVLPGKFQCILDLRFSQ
jgi:hypothetical protein